MAPLNVVPTQVVEYGNEHDAVGAQVHTDSNGDGTTLGSLMSALGPTGTMFTAAVVKFDAAMQNSGNQLTGK